MKLLSWTVLSVLLMLPASLVLAEQGNTGKQEAEAVTVAAYAENYLSTTLASTADVVRDEAYYQSLVGEGEDDHLQEAVRRQGSGSVEDCVERLKQEYPRLRSAVLKERCAGQTLLARLAEAPKPVRRITQKVQSRLSSLSEEQQVKLRLLTRKALDRIGSQSPEQAAAALDDYAVVQVYDDKTGYKKRTLGAAQRTTLKNRYEALRNRHQQLEQAMQQKRELFEEYKEKEARCADDETIDCEAIQQQAIEHAKAFLQRVGEVQLNMMERLETRVESSEELSDEHVKAILADIEDKQANLIDALHAVDAATTKKEVKTAGAPVLASGKQFRNRYVVYEYRLFHEGIRNLLTRAKILDRKLDRLLAYLDDHEGDTSKIEPMVEEYSALLDSSITHFQQADEVFKKAWKAKFNESYADEEVKSLVEEAKSFARQAKQDLKDAAGKLREIFALAKEHHTVLLENREEDRYALLLPVLSVDDESGDDDTDLEEPGEEETEDQEDDDDTAGEDTDNTEDQEGEETFSAYDPSVRCTNAESRVIYNGKPRSMMTGECVIDQSSTGEISLVIQLEERNKPNNEIEFSVTTPSENKRSLVRLGAHNSRGEHGDRFNNRLSSSAYSWILEPGQVDVVWDEVSSNLRMFYGSGCIRIKETLQRECPERIWVGGYYVYPGEEEYRCTYEDDYLPPQRIAFSCEDGDIL